MAPVASPNKTFQFEDLKKHIAGQQDYMRDVTSTHYFGFPIAPVLDAESRLLSPELKSTAYFSMEFGIAPSIYNSFDVSRPMKDANNFFTHEVFSNYWLCDYLFKIHIDKMLDIPIYGGGLGVLAGDTIKSAADLGFSIAGIGILWNKGYFKQNFWYKHGQVPEELQWDPYAYPGLIPLKNVVTIDTLKGPLKLRLWKYYVYSYDRRHACPIVLLDSNLEKNTEHFRRLTDQLYRSDDVWWKLFQRVILGIGGVKALASLGYTIDCHHLNEGHAAFALLEKYVSLADKSKMADVKKRFVFTCHTPVAAGHDRFAFTDVKRVLPAKYVQAAARLGQKETDAKQVNLTSLCLNNCAQVNAVAKKHGEVMHLQFPDFADKIESITNGVHLHTWLSSSFAQLFDKYKKVFGHWKRNPQNLARVTQLRESRAFRRDLFLAHQANKRDLVDILKRWQLRDDVLTLGWARRIAGYKRPALIFHHVEKMIRLAYNKGPVQVILAGKAHPNDNIGAAHIDEILEHIDQLNDHWRVIKVLILENYDTYFGKLLTNSVDVWLNNPLPPFEASGTSGMKAILNGVVQCSTLDGWMVEAADHDVGWTFGYRHAGAEIGQESDLRLDEDSQALYDALAEMIPLYYKTYSKGKVSTKSLWIDKMINGIAQGAFFNTQRMVKQYNQKFWQLDEGLPS